MQELNDVEKIRKVTKGVYRELNPFVDDNSGRVPVFGFPLICYSPINKDDKKGKGAAFSFPDGQLPPYHYQ